MFDNRERKEHRLTIEDGASTVSRRSFNVVMAPTVLFGIVLDVLMAVFLGELISGLEPLALALGSLAVAIAAVFVIYWSANPLVSFFGFTLLSAAMGVTATYCVGLFDYTIVIQAFAATAIVVFAMLVAGAIFPDFFRGLGRVLFFSLLALIVVELLFMVFGIAEPVFVDWIVVAIFCLYIGYDFVRSQEFPPTLDNAIDSAADIYVDIMNLFIRFLSIFSSAKD